MARLVNETESRDSTKQERKNKMKKYEVEYSVDENHTIIYEIEAESEEHVQQMLDDGCFLDYATQKEDRLDYYEDEVEEIREVSTPTTPQTEEDRYKKAMEHLSEAYDLLYNLIGTSDVLETVSSAIDELRDLEKGIVGTTSHDDSVDNTK